MTEPPLPTFLVIGAQKSATRWLKTNLGSHPDVFVAEGEPGFFHDPEQMESRGTSWYRDQFEGWSGETHVGEGTPGYMIWHHRPADVAARINATLPDVRLLAILRNPIDRAQSSMVHHMRVDRVGPDTSLVDLASGLTLDTTPQPFEAGWGGPETVITGGWYGASLAPYVEVFSDRLLVLIHDDLDVDPTGVYERAAAHIGADPDFVPETLTEVRHSAQAEAADRAAAEPKRRWFRRERPAPDEPTSPTVPPLSAADRAEMYGYFADDVALLERLIDRDLSLWRPA